MPASCPSFASLPASLVFPMSTDPYVAISESPRPPLALLSPIWGHLRQVKAMTGVLDTVATESSGSEVDGVLDALLKICEDYPSEAGPPTRTPAFLAAIPCAAGPCLMGPSS